MDEEVVDLGSLSLDEPPFDEGPVRKVEQTRATLAYLLFGLLAGVLVALFILLGTGTITPQGFESVAGVVLSPIAALLGAATGYYYGKGGS
ncbi:MAG TPA: hypothetical protein VN886_05665 [Acidimicrobiales bacterium]|nr:hypothetical protein [Acidimicrobiales bacterium]